MIYQELSKMVKNKLHISSQMVVVIFQVNDLK
jgi:hypothetical protein